MSHLTIYAEDEPDKALLSTGDLGQIQEKLAEAGITLKRWHTDHALSDDAGNDSIIAAYQSEIDQLVASGGFQSYDVVSMNADHPDKGEFRQKFLAEHTHSEDEIRFFVRGHGLFIMHVKGHIYSMLCEKDDLISVPADTKHWFDMGPNPTFTAIRLFNNPQGWVANFTGDDIAGRFPLLEN
jgi:1,2-dihydroxy-3-keto-5-methylthiopentene dioxygenase